ncbi:hypothetical protein [Methanobacterium alcaliphilum]|uniref:hypothetical protein n=1 Tax=Methanobacterium alcaliphilum TaxID=392018 RepID=UPI002009E55B|nr:hypothetical protein [Methanobacterium alcaliphilum]MCK9152081.1 hypothetical protein [Methanobacterium alcaliphilum]
MLFGSPDLITDLIVISTVFLGIGTIILLLILLYIYWGSFKEIRSEYTIGLLFFASTLLLQNILLTASYFASSLNHWFEGIPGFSIVVLEFIGLFILLKISWE